MRWKEIIASAVSLAATPIALAGLLRALWTWRRQKVLKRLRKVHDVEPGVSVSAQSVALELRSFGIPKLYSHFSSRREPRSNVPLQP
jgi:hypothetical protein